MRMVSRKAFHDAHIINISSPRGTDAIVLPELISLTIAHAHFSFPLGERQLFSTLKRALTRRLEVEWTMPDITLVGCHITPQQLADLNTVALEPVYCIGRPDTWGVGEEDQGSSDEGSASDDN